MSISEQLGHAYRSEAVYDVWCATRRQLTFHDWFWIVYAPAHFDYV